MDVARGRTGPVAPKSKRSPARTQTDPASPGAAPAIRLWLRNEAGRRGVPLRPSFERWLAAIPALRARRRGVEVNILIVGTSEGRRFNREFRGRDYATNVLSFPFGPGASRHRGPLGDLVICAPVVAREAREQAKPLRDHYAHLTIHGVLHLLGHDHENDRDAERMESLERAALAGLGVPDPYVDGTLQPDRGSRR